MLVGVGLGEAGCSCFLNFLIGRVFDLGAHHTWVRSLVFFSFRDRRNTGLPPLFEPLFGLPAHALPKQTVPCFIWCDFLSQ